MHRSVFSFVACTVSVPLAGATLRGCRGAMGRFGEAAAIGCAEEGMVEGAPSAVAASANEESGMERGEMIGLGAMSGLGAMNGESAADIMGDVASAQSA